ncbi:MAG: hypothetical protein RL226_498 [Bacteroidota bacterium]|jgi:23S rRNA (cytosine1962-C5)-methyltransferase
MERLWIRFEPHWNAYRLLDSGDGEKLEQFGGYVLRRPEVTAIWPKQLAPSEWAAADASFFQQDARSGIWKQRRPIKEPWNMVYQLHNHKLTFQLYLTTFKHVGVFPEQASNWEFIAERVKQQQQPNVLNLFAYTGGASLAARASGADVTHVDSIKPTVTWANENMVASGLSNIRWMVEDALTFVKREVKRGKTYTGIIMDPPAWGSGGVKNQSKWKLEDQLNDLLENTAKILDPQGFIVLNTYSGLANSTLETLITSYFRFNTIATGDLILRSDTEQVLCTGSCLRGWTI